MNAEMTLEEFRTRNRVTEEDWMRSGCSWDDLKKIANDHVKNHELLRETAEAFARIIQKFTGVHSVRWRVKDAEHLLEKIIRKKAEGNNKYADIDQNNYKGIVTDLVGIRALHLFKDECFEIDVQLRNTWEAAETPIAYFREGDHVKIREAFENLGFETQDHKAGYRSVHYILPSNLTHQKIFVELQVRTIFEEGWSEIDHRVRYPNFLDDPQIALFLAIFNRTAGSADEMGSFVRDLAKEFEARKVAENKIAAERDEALEKMQNMLKQMANAEKRDAKRESEISALRAQLDVLKRAVESSTTRENIGQWTSARFNEGASNPFSIESQSKLFKANNPFRETRSIAQDDALFRTLSGRRINEPGLTAAEFAKAVGLGTGDATHVVAAAKPKKSE
ncbi:RelA/SpoT domain-containing protein [Burkholderia cepacia]|uniref:RelA/SpoT domain-containing protein n=1 Tax=Burkholderia cepacia TaxID=292 RepID=UPI0009C18078|nr:hypothetical protein [Burkholderia cepacia]